MMNLPIVTVRTDKHGTVCSRGSRTKSFIVLGTEHAVREKWLRSDRTHWGVLRQADSKLLTYTTSRQEARDFRMSPGEKVVALEWINDDTVH